MIRLEDLLSGKLKVRIISELPAEMTVTREQFEKMKRPRACPGCELENRKSQKDVRGSTHEL